MFKYNIIFCINGRILVQSNTTGEYFKYDYNNLNNFLCVCSLNNGNIPTTDEEYKNAQNKIITSFVDENDYFTEEAKELIKKDTEGKKAAIDSFYSLNQSEIMYLKDAFDYFCPENELEERLEELEFEIRETEEEISQCENDMECCEGFGSQYNNFKKASSTCVYYLEKLFQEKELIEEALKNNPNTTLEEIQSKL